MSYYDSDALTMIARKLIIRRFRNGMFNGLNRTDGEDVLLKVILLHLHRKMYGCKCSNVPIKVRQCEQTRAMARSKLFVRANATKTLKIVIEMKHEYFYAHECILLLLLLLPSSSSLKIILVSSLLSRVIVFIARTRMS